MRIYITEVIKEIEVNEMDKNNTKEVLITKNDIGEMYCNNHRGGSSFGEYRYEVVQEVFIKEQPYYLLALRHCWQSEGTSADSFYLADKHGALFFLHEGELKGGIVWLEKN